MRSVAPDRPGSAASQNSWSVVKLKPTAGSLATTTDHTIQTAKDSSSAGIEIQRLRRAIARPGALPERLDPPAASPASTAPDSAPTCSGLWIACISGSSGSLRSAVADGARAPSARIATCIQTSAAGDEQEQQHEAALPDAGEVVEHAEGDRQHEAAEAADQADEAADRADMFGIVDRDVLVDRRLAQAHEEAEHEHHHDEGDEAHLHVEARSGRLMPCTT